MFFFFFLYELHYTVLYYSTLLCTVLYISAAQKCGVSDLIGKLPHPKYTQYKEFGLYYKIRPVGSADSAECGYDFYPRPMERYRIINGWKILDDYDLNCGVEIAPENQRQGRQFKNPAL